MAVLPGAALKCWSVLRAENMEPHGLICCDSPGMHEAMGIVQLRKMSQHQSSGLAITPQSSTWDAVIAGAAALVRNIQNGGSW